LDSLQTALLKKFRSDELASLYLISYNPESTDPVTWVDQFQKELTPLTDHPDILRLFKGEKETEYKVDSKAIKEFLSFISTRPLQLSKKFIFLFDAHDLSVIVSNKLLKVFEELGPDYCLMLFAPRNAQLLETVQGRAVKLSLTHSEFLKTEEISPFLEVKTPQDLLVLLKDADNELMAEKKYIEYAISQTLSSCQKSGRYEELEKLLTQLKEYETRLTFNNSRLSRLSVFFP
jgi:hypothetical protein